MTKKLQLCIRLCLCVLLTGFASSLYAQRITEGTRSGELRILAERYDQRQKQTFQQFRRLLGDTTVLNQYKHLIQDSLILGLERIAPDGQPIVNEINSNLGAANTTRASALWTGGRNGLNLNGEGITFGVWEAFDVTPTGQNVAAVLPTHQELAGRVNIRDGATLPGGFGANHGTHVAGTLAAAGIVGDAKGMASKALIDSYDVNNDEAEMAAAAAAGLRISQHSYGFRAATINAAYRGAYAINASEWDQIANAAPNYFIGKSAGNDGNVANTPFPAGFNTLTGSSNSKNIMVIANASIVNTYTGPSSVVITASSTKGPTDDGRIKPDITGAGTSIYSSIGNSNNAYNFLTGTSMSGPNVTGTAGLLQQYWGQLFPGVPMRSATLRGLIIHTADEAGPGPGPDYTFGWGLMNAERAANVLTSVKNETSNPKHLIDQRVRAQGEADYSLNVVASGTEPLRVTIVWNDPAAPNRDTPTTLPPLDDFTSVLVNDLDVRVIDNTTGTPVTFLPWVMPYQLDPSAANRANLATQAATRGDNTRDNVEQILIPNAVPGRTYTIVVSHKGTLAAPQEYTLIVSGIGGTAPGASGALEDGGARIDRFRFGTINNSTATECATYRDFTKLNTTPPAFGAGQAVALEVDLGTCDANANKHVRIYADWNGDGDFEDAGELLASSTAPVLASGTASLNNASVLLPSSVVQGQLVRIRVVTVETNDVNTISPTGNYPRGETQDYLIAIAAPLADVGVERIFPPAGNACVGASLPVIVRIRNFGSAAVSNIPVEISLNGTEVLSHTFVGTLAAGAFVDVAVGNITVPSVTDFSLGARTALSTDGVASNNTALPVTVPVLPAAVLDATSVSSCGATEATDLISLIATTNAPRNVVAWYDAPTGGNRLAIGNQTSITKAQADALPTANTVYAGLNDFNLIGVGPINTTLGSSGAGGYVQATARPIFEVTSPFIITSAKMYISASANGATTPVGTPGTPVGSVIFTVVDVNTGALKSSSVIPVNVTDANGAYFPVNIVFSEPGTYSLAIEYIGAWGLFRNNSVPMGTYPVNLGTGRIIGTTATPAPGTGFYYWLYDMTIVPAGCAAGARQAVTIQNAGAQTATIQADANVVCDGQTTTLRATETGAGLSYQWQRRTGAAAFANIAGATGATLEVGRVAFAALIADEVFEYRVVIVREDGCQATSAASTITVVPVPARLSISLDRAPDFCEGESVNLNLSAITGLPAAAYRYTWKRDGEVVATNEGNNSLNVTQAGAYTVELVRIDGNCDMMVSENTVLVTSGNPEISASDVEVCPESPVQLNASSNAGSIFWYDAASSGNLLGTGNSLSLPAITENRTVYAGVNDFGGTLDSPNINAGNSASNFTGGRMYFDAAVPFVLEKATIRVATAGTMTVIIVDKDFSNAIIAQRTIAVTAGTNEYTLDLYVPYAGQNFGIQVSAFGGGATAFRHNTAGSVAFPYKIDNFVSVTGTNQVDQTAFYYYLYQWQVKAAGCALAERKAVTARLINEPAPTAVLSGGGELNTATTQVGLNIVLTGKAPWSIAYTRNGGEAITVSDIAASPYTLNVTEAGTYALTSLTDANGCAAGTVSGTATVTRATVTSLGEDLAQRFAVYPNPSSDKVHLQIPAALAGKSFTIQLSNVVGVSVATFESSSTVTQIDTAQLPKGVYILSVEGAGKSYRERIVIQ